MKELISFLLENEQANYRKLAQLQNERFENTIDSYRDIFINHFNEICERSLDDSSLKQEYPRDILAQENIKSYFKNIQSELKKIKIEEITYFFKELKDIYLNWMKSDSVSAVLLLENLMEEKNILDFKKNIIDMLLYRGRKKDSYSFNKFDMFHIPYDKRYLISNQRYSLPGIPFLYLGSSIYDIFTELDGDFKNPSDIYCSFFKINKEKYLEKEYEVFDLTNDFYKIFKDAILNSIVSFEKIDYLRLKRILFKFILASVCSFEKTSYKINVSGEEKNKFYEEYILPQILTQVLIRKGYKGVMYSSTKLNKKVTNIFSKINVTLFTKYNPNHHYDKELYENFNISHPIAILEEIENENINIKNLEKLADDIEKLNPENKSSEIVLDFKNNRGKIKIDKNEYLSHPFGKTELFLIYSYLIIEKNKFLKKKLNIVE